MTIDRLQELKRSLPSGPSSICNEGTYIDPTKMSVAEYLEHWLSVDIERRVARKIAVRHRQLVERQIAPRLGQMAVRQLTPTHIEAFEAELQRSGHVKGRKAGQGLTAQTVLHVHRTLSQALAHAVKAEVLFENPAEQLACAGASCLGCAGQTSI